MKPPKSIAQGSIQLPWPTPLTEHERQWRAICAAKRSSFLAWLLEHRGAA